MSTIAQASELSREQAREETRSTIRRGASLTLTYAVMNMLATIIACYGLLVDSTAGIIGAMVVALLLGPIEGVGLALVDSEKFLRKRDPDPPISPSLWQAESRPLWRPSVEA